MSMTVYVPVDTKTPGVVTKVEQQIDLASLPAEQFTRVINAAKAGVVNGEGYIAELLKRIAQAHKIMPPVVIAKSDWQGTRVRHPMLSRDDMAEHRDELMKLSNVRHQMALASSGKQASEWDRKRESAFYDNHNRTPTLSLVGWGKSTVPLKKEIQKRICSHPLFKEAQQKLVAAVMTKPIMTISRTAKD